MVSKVKKGGSYLQKNEIVISKGMRQLNLKMKQDNFSYPHWWVRERNKVVIIYCGNKKIDFPHK